MPAIGTLIKAAGCHISRSFTVRTVLMSHVKCQMRTITCDVWPTATSGPKLTAQTAKTASPPVLANLTNLCTACGPLHTPHDCVVKQASVPVCAVTCGLK